MTQRLEKRTLKVQELADVVEALVIAWADGTNASIDTARVNWAYATMHKYLVDHDLVQPGDEEPPF